LFNHDLDGFASAFYEHTERPFFTGDRIDFSLQTLKRFSPTPEFPVFDGLPDGRYRRHSSEPLAEKLRAERGIFQIARFGTSYIQDRRNDPLNPSSGSFNTTTFRWQGVRLAQN